MASFIAALSVAIAAAAAAADPYLWLEDVQGARAMQWVQAENAKTHATLDSDPRFKSLLADARRIAEADDRIPSPTVIDGQVFNFWQDAAHPHGIWRKASLADYQSPQPRWKTVLDLDALSKAEKANWFWKGADCDRPTRGRCIVSLSDGGQDAVTLREWDLDAEKFVAGGFSFPSAMQDFAWEDDNTLLVSREWKRGELTKAGYPFVIKRVVRGHAPDTAAEVFRGTVDDLHIRPYAFVDGDGHRISILSSGDASDSKSYLVGSRGTQQLPVPKDMDWIGLLAGRLLLRIKEDWKPSEGPPLPRGSVVSLSLAATISDPQNPRPTLVYAPGPREAFVDARATRGHLLVRTLRDVHDRLDSYAPGPGNGWSKQSIELPINVSVDIVDADIHSERAFIVASGFLTPPELILLDLGKSTRVSVKTLPAQFDSTRHVVEQHEAISSDGVHIPYFVVRPTGRKLDGTTPTILHAYGGFLTPQTPHYSADLGKLWLERGGAFVLANIRGGGEFGPAWHEAGLKTRRQIIYDDFVAVARDIVAKGFTSAAHLGIRGASNGGLLMGVQFTQHPEMWSAVDFQVPMLDLLRYEQIAAGSSWTAEFGSVDNPAEKAFLASISPYNNLRAGVRYPEPLLWSTSKDDRVGPQHARKFAAKLAALGVPYFYYELTEGGHSSAATLGEHAEMTAREYTYFSRKLGL